MMYTVHLKTFDDLTKGVAFVVALQSQLLFCIIFFFIICRDYCWKYSRTAGLAFELSCSKLNSLNWRHLVSVRGCWLPTQVHRIQCHLFSQISSLSPSCHLSAWQHKVIASRCNQDYMLVTHSMHSVAYNVWNRHKIKPVHRWEDKMLLNIHQFPDCSNVSPGFCH